MGLKQNTANWVEVYIEDAAGAPVLGLAFNAGTKSHLLHKAGGNVAAWAPADATAWKETGLGFYMTRFEAGDCDTVGRLVLTAKVTGGAANATNEIVDSALPADVLTQVTALAALVARTLGLSLDNTREDQMLYGTGANSGPTDLCSSRLRGWDSAANANAGGAGGLVYSYDLTWSYSAPGVLSEQKVIRTL